MELFFRLLIVHAVCDFSLHSDFLAKGKDPWGQVGKGGVWFHCLTAHALIHAGGVLVVTGSSFLAALELCCHWLIDFGKCGGRYGYHVDQLLHVWCKVTWCLYALYAMGGAA